MTTSFDSYQEYNSLIPCSIYRTLYDSNDVVIPLADSGDLPNAKPEGEE
jgi:hypothetical protein